MWNIIIRTQYRNGGVKVVRREASSVEIEYWENYYSDTYSFPDVESATVINAFYVEQEK